ncbi:MAG TPA: hypothetical protein VF092_15180 [Longimicrobium sp.]
MNFEQGDDRPAGHVFGLPPEARFGDDPKRRPHLLLHRCRPAELGTLAHMTTKLSEEIGYGAPAHEIAECSRKLRYPGQQGCFVTPVRLLFQDASLLDRSDACYASSLHSVCAVTAKALGLRSGLGAPGSPSVRGHLAVLSREVKEAFEFGHGVVLTQHEYSAQRRWQLLVPILDLRDLIPVGADPDSFTPEPWDVVPEPASWSTGLPRGWVRPVIDTARLITFSERWTRSRDRDRWLKGQIERILPASVDLVTLSRIEDALAARLCL